MRLSKIKSLLALISIVATFFFSEAKMQTKEIIFSSTDITSLSGTSSSVEIDGESVSMNYSSGISIVKTVNYPDGIEDALGIYFPKNGYLMMKFPHFNGLTVSKVEIETWVEGSNNSVQLTVASLDSSGLSDQSFRKVNSTVTNPDISTFSNYLPISYTPLNGDNVFLEYGLKLYFENKSSTAKVGLKSIKVTYDDGEPEDMELTVLLDGEPAEDGQLVEPGSVLTIDTGGTPDALIAYRIGDANIDNLLPAEGLTLSQPGTFIYHFTAEATGYKQASIDFTFTILGKIVVDSETIDLAQSAEQHGFTIFEPGSDKYETEHNLWEEDDIQFFFNEGEEIRMERQEDGEVLLMLNPGAKLQVSLIENSDKILTAGIEGLHTENLEISILEEDDYSRSVKRTVSWDAAGQRAAALLITNTGSEPAGISTLALEIEKNIATDVKDVEETENPVPEYYDLTGHKVMNPENGIFVERAGKKARVVVIRH